MNFKKLLSMIGMLSVVVPTSLTVVACGTPATSQDQKDADTIKANFIKGIVESKLDETMNKKDALNKLTTEAQKINAHATLAFVNKDDAITPLTQGDNTLLINITVGQATDNNVSAKVTKVGAETDQEFADAIKNALTANSIDGSTLDVTKTQGNALTTLLVPIAININKNATLTFVHKDDAKANLKKGDDNTLLINITVGTATDTSVSVKVTKVAPESDQEFADAIKNALTANSIDGSSLDVTKTQGNALTTLLVPIAININKNATLTFVHKDDAKANLKKGDDNTLLININVGTATDTSVSVKVTKVAPESDQEFADAIKNALTANSIDGSTLDVTKTQGDALTTLLVPIATNINKNATLTFVHKDDAKANLKKGDDNTLLININVGTATDTSVSVKVTKVAPESDQEFADAIKNALTANSIDGSTLDVTKTQGNALTTLLVPIATNINKNATLTFVHKDDAKANLKKGDDNTLLINITIGTATDTNVSVKVTKVGLPTDKELGNFISSNIKASATNYVILFTNKVDAKTGEVALIKQLNENSYLFNQVKTNASSDQLFSYVEQNKITIPDGTKIYEGTDKKFEVADDWFNPITYKSPWKINLTFNYGNEKGINVILELWVKTPSN